jgi:hypothetical protein
LAYKADLFKNNIFCSNPFVLIAIDTTLDCMETDTKLHLVYQDYTWDIHPKSNLLLNMADTNDLSFDRKNGNHMMHLIKSYMHRTGYTTQYTASTVERIIRSKLPKNIKTQQQVHQWLDENFKFNM